MNKEQDDQERQPILIEKDNNSQYDWETFKKQYYQQENILQQSLKQLNEMHSEISKKLIQLDKSDPICEQDEQDYRRLFQSINIRKYEEQFDDLNQIKATMTIMLNDFILNPDEIQFKLKSNMLKRFKEIHQEHEKEVLKLKQAIKTNQQKYELFKEAIQGNNGQSRQKYKKDVDMNDYFQRGLTQASHVLDIAQNVHSNLQNQGYRVNQIQNKVTDYMGQFDGIGQLINGIRYHQNKSQLVLIVLAAILLIIIIMKLI